MLVILGSVGNSVPNLLVTSGPLYLPYGTFLYLLAFSLILGLAVFLLTFPTGRFTPRWSWVMVFLWVGLFASFNLPLPFNVSNWPGLLFAGELLLTIGGTLGVQIYRYRRIYTPVQRQQTKWLVFGLSVGVAIQVLSIAIGSLAPGFDTPDSPYQLFNGFFSDIVFVSIPLAVGVSILRYRLYDIDVIIRRTLIYGSLTAILAAVYLVSVISMQLLVNSVTGQKQQSAVVVVLSTLLIAALFQPLRGRIQHTIDRRFFRAKYDAAKTLAAFSATLPSETDRPSLTSDLVGG